MDKTFLLWFNDLIQVSKLGPNYMNLLTYWVYIRCLSIQPWRYQ